MLKLCSIKCIFSHFTTLQIEKHKKTFFNRFLWSKEIICVIIIYRVFSYIHIILIGVKIMTPEEKSILVKSQKLSSLVDGMHKKYIIIPVKRLKELGP